LKNALCVESFQRTLPESLRAIYLGSQIEDTWTFLSSRFISIQVSFSRLGNAKSTFAASRSSCSSIPLKALKILNSGAKFEITVVADVQLVAGQTGKSVEEARKALEECDGDLAKAILLLQS
jgi:hypothetical protein